MPDASVGVRAGFEEILLQMLVKNLPILPASPAGSHADVLMEGLLKPALAHAWAESGFLSSADRTGEGR
jgi:hypothetical protein